MAVDVFIDTSGFYAQWDRNDVAHERTKAWLIANRGKFVPVTTEWVIGETCTLLGARGVPHLIGPFLDQLAASRALRSINPDAETLDETKRFLRRHASQGYSFVDCLSFCVMKNNRVVNVLTTDHHFRKAGFRPLLVAT
jgi:predicted nucleic acid-binding protein